MSKNKETEKPEPPKRPVGVRYVKDGVDTMQQGGNNKKDEKKNVRDQ
ncbi:hypothetical protein ACIMS2_003346 [Vibrio harveyi]